MDDVRRLSFGTVAETYDAARPSYPDGLIGDVVAYAGAGPGTRALEVGAGTGKATVLFAERGLAIHALEPSAAMAAVGRRHCVGFPDVTFEAADFESASPGNGYTLVYAAQSWHWVDPERRYALARRALAGGGALAAFWNRVDWSRCALRAALDAAYADAGVTLDDHGPMCPGAPSPLDLGDEWVPQIATAAGFAAAEIRHYAWNCDYGAAEYARLLATHSDHIVLDEPRREALLTGIVETIDRCGGTIQLPYVTILCLARAT
jgi:SAM-dependent methyltransferase